MRGLVTCSEQVRGCIFLFPSSFRNSVLQDGEDTRRFYWVHNVSVWFSEAPASIKWLPSVSQHLQLTRTATPAHCEHHLLCARAIPWVFAAARSWAGTLGYSCLWALLLQLFVFTYLWDAVPAAPWPLSRRGGDLLSFSCLECAKSHNFPEKPLWPEVPGPFTGRWRMKTVCDGAADSCLTRMVHSAWNFWLKRHFFMWLRSCQLNHTAKME